MKIAMFTDTYKPQINGVVTSVKRFSIELRKRGHEVYIFSPGSEEFKTNSKGLHTFKSITFKRYPEYKIDVPYELLKPNLRKMGFDIVHIHTPFSVGMAGIILAKRYKIPVVGNFHTLLSECVHYLIDNEKLENIDEVKRIAKKLTWKYTSWFYNQCHCVITPSSEIKRMLKQYDFKKDIHVIPTGVRLMSKRKSKKRLRKMYGFQQDDKLIIHVGRITKEKNIKFIIDEVKKLIEKDDKIKLIITSDGPYKHRMEKHVEELGIKSNVIFTGYMSRKRLNNYYYISDVFVMGSKTETQGIVLLEATARSLPIVVLNVPVISDFVEKNNIGFIADKREFAKTVEKVINSKSIRKKMVKNSKEALKKYNIENCTNKLMEIYQDLSKFS